MGQQRAWQGRDVLFGNPEMKARLETWLFKGSSCDFVDRKFELTTAFQEMERTQPDTFSA